MSYFNVVEGLIINVFRSKLSLLPFPSFLVTHVLTYTCPLEPLVKLSKSSAHPSLCERTIGSKEPRALDYKARVYRRVMRQ